MASSSKQVMPPRAPDMNTLIELERARLTWREWKSAPEEAQALCPVKSDDVGIAPNGIGYTPAVGYYVIRSDMHNGPSIIWPKNVGQDEGYDV